MRHPRFGNSRRSSVAAEVSADQVNAVCVDSIRRESETVKP